MPRKTPLAVVSQTEKENEVVKHLQMQIEQNNRRKLERLMSEREENIKLLKITFTGNDTTDEQMSFIHSAAKTRGAEHVAVWDSGYVESREEDKCGVVKRLIPISRSENSQKGEHGRASGRRQIWEERRLQRSFQRRNKDSTASTGAISTREEASVADSESTAVATASRVVKTLFSKPTATFGSRNSVPIHPEADSTKNKNSTEMNTVYDINEIVNISRDKRNREILLPVKTEISSSLEGIGDAREAKRSQIREELNREMKDAMFSQRGERAVHSFRKSIESNEIRGDVTKKRLSNQCVDNLATVSTGYKDGPHSFEGVLVSLPDSLEDPREKQRKERFEAENKRRLVDLEDQMLLASQIKARNALETNIDFTFQKQLRIDNAFASSVGNILEADNHSDSPDSCFRSRVVNKKSPNCIATDEFGGTLVYPLISGENSGSTAHENTENSNHIRQSLGDRHEQMNTDCSENVTDRKIQSLLYDGIDDLRKKIMELEHMLANKMSPICRLSSNPEPFNFTQFSEENCHPINTINPSDQSTQIQRVDPSVQLSLCELAHLHGLADCPCVHDREVCQFVSVYGVPGCRFHQPPGTLNTGEIIQEPIQETNSGQMQNFTRAFKRKTPVGAISAGLFDENQSEPEETESTMEQHSLITERSMKSVETKFVDIDLMKTIRTNQRMERLCDANRIEFPPDEHFKRSFQTSTRNESPDFWDSSDLDENVVVLHPHNTMTFPTCVYRFSLEM